MVTEQEGYDTIRFQVEHLPDSTLPSSKCSTGISKRIYDRRYEYYQDQRQQLRALLETIGREAETQISSVIRNLQEELGLSDKRVDQFLYDCDPKTCETASLGLLIFRNGADKIDQELDLRQQNINQAQSVIEEKEKIRKEKVSDAFDSFLPKMMENSHLLAHEISRIMEQELLVINQLILRNQRTYAGLFERLLVETTFKAKQSHERLKLYEAEWKSLKLEEALQEAKLRLETCCDVRPEDVDRIVDGVRENQQPLLWAKVSILNERLCLFPPEITVAKCRDWLTKAEVAITDFCDASLQGIQEVDQFGDSLHLEFFDGIVQTAQTLQKNLNCPVELVNFKFQEPCMHFSAQKQALLEHDLLSYTLEIVRRKDEEIALLRKFFAFLHGAVWHWELHLTSVAKAEDFLDGQIRRLRGVMNQLTESKAGKFKAIFETLRHSWTPAVTTAQLHAAGVATADLEHQLRESWNKALEVFASYPVLIEILSRGYKQRIFAYFQVRQEDPTAPVSSHISSNPAAPAMPQAIDRTEVSEYRLPDLMLNEEEKTHLFELGLTASDTEDLGIHMKCLPAPQDDPRPPPPENTIHTEKGVVLCPCPTELTDCFRFTPIKPPESAQHDPNLVVPVAETESQIQATLDLTSEIPPRFGCVDLSALLDNLPDLEKERSAVACVQTGLIEAFLKHVVDEWDDLVRRNSYSLMETKKEALELEVQTRLRCLNLRSIEFLDVIAQKRAREVSEHEEQFKAIETEVISTTSKFKLEDIAGVNKLINERLVMTRDNMVLLEKTLVNATRQGQIDNIKKRLKNEVSRYMAFVKQSVTELRSKIPTKCLQVQQRVRQASAAMKKFPDGGTYAPDEFRHYEQSFSKFIDKLSAAEKSTLEEARLIEVKRKSVIESFLVKLSEKVPAHEADVVAVRALTDLLAKTQAAIKKEAALINSGYADVKEQCDKIKSAIGELRENVTTSKVKSESLLNQMLVLLQELHSSCSQLGCLVPLWTVYSPSNSPPASQSREASLTSPQSRVSPTGSSLLHSSNPSSLLQRESSVKAPDRSSVQSTRHSTGFQSSVHKRARTEPVREIPTDFQLQTPDGPVPLVLPRILAPFDSKSIGLNRAASSPVQVEITTKMLPRTGESGRDSIVAIANNAAQKRKQKRLERYLIFGEAPFVEPKTFLELVHTTCWNALNTGLNLAEEYHRVRGSRAITRPTLISDSFEVTSEKICKKLLNYLSQSEQFAFVLTEKFRNLSNGIMDMTIDGAPYLFRRCLETFRTELMLKKRLLLDEFVMESTLVCDLREDVDDLNLRPTIVRENDVNGMLLEISQRITAEWLKNCRRLTTEFLLNLNTASEKLFAICDLIHSPDELRVNVTPPTLAIRAQSRLSNPASPILPTDDKYRNRPGQLWRALLLEDVTDFDEQIVGFKDVQCTKTTMAHLAVEDARHRVFAEFLELLHKAKSSVKAFEVAKRKVSDDAGEKEFVHLQLKRLQVLDKMV